MRIDAFELTRLEFPRDRVIGDSQVRTDQVHIAALELIDEAGERGLGFAQALLVPIPAKAEIERCRRLRIPCGVALPDHPGERRRHLAFIKSVPEAYVAAILRDKSLPGYWQDLPLATLRQLTTTLKNRRATFNKPRPVQRELAAANENEPF